MKAAEVAVEQLESARTGKADEGDVAALTGIGFALLALIEVLEPPQPQPCDHKWGDASSRPTPFASSWAYTTLQTCQRCGISRQVT